MNWIELCSRYRGSRGSRRWSELKSVVSEFVECNSRSQKTDSPCSPVSSSLKVHWVQHTENPPTVWHQHGVGGGGLHTIHKRCPSGENLMLFWGSLLHFLSIFSLVRRVEAHYLVAAPKSEYFSLGASPLTRHIKGFTFIMACCDARCSDRTPPPLLA